MGWPGDFFTWLQSLSSAKIVTHKADKSGRLDRFYVPLSWKNLVSSVTAPVYSDHSLIRMTCTVGHSRFHGSLNKSLLKSDEFCEETNKFWQHCTQKTSFSDPRVWWDAGN